MHANYISYTKIRTIPFELLRIATEALLLIYCAISLTFVESSWNIPILGQEIFAISSASDCDLELTRVLIINSFASDWMERTLKFVEFKFKKYRMNVECTFFWIFFFWKSNSLSQTEFSQKFIPFRMQFSSNKQPLAVTFIFHIYTI